MEEYELTALILNDLNRDIIMEIVGFITTLTIAVLFAWLAKNNLINAYYSKDPIYGIIVVLESIASILLFYLCFTYSPFIISLR